jgi:hypothetical protein
MNPKVVTEVCAELTLLRFFPSDENARAALVLLIGRMCSTEDQVRWLVRRTLAICNEWPGPLVLRQILCSKFRPADGISAGGSSAFPDGAPSEKRIDAPALSALPPGYVVSADKQLDDAVKSLAASKGFKRLALPVAPTPRVLRDPLTAEQRASIEMQIARLIEERRAGGL